MTDKRIQTFLNSVDKLIEQVNKRITDDVELQDLFKFDSEILEIKGVYDSILETQVLENKIDLDNLKSNVENLLNDFSSKVNEFDTSKDNLEDSVTLIIKNLNELKVALETSVNSKITDINKTKEDLTTSVNSK